MKIEFSQDEILGAVQQLFVNEVLAEEARIRRLQETRLGCDGNGSVLDSKVWTTINR